MEAGELMVQMRWQVIPDGLSHPQQETGSPKARRCRPSGHHRVESVLWGIGAGKWAIHTCVASTFTSILSTLGRTSDLERCGQRTRVLRDSCGKIKYMLVTRLEMYAVI